MQFVSINQLEMKNNKTINPTQHNNDVAVIWARVSQESQASELELQVEACKDYAKKNGIEITQTIKVVDSGLGSPLCKEMLTFVAQHPEINTILIFSFDRISRADVGVIVTRAFLESKGVNLISIMPPQEYDCIAGELIENVLLLYKQLENNFCNARRHRHSQKSI